jgi:hypothetical protein
MSFTLLKCSLLTNYDVQCSATTEKPHVGFFRLVEDPHRSPPPQTPLYTPDLHLTLSTRTSSQQPVAGEFEGRFAVSGCAKRRVNIKGVRSACASHCRSLDGCWSQPPLTTFPVPTPTFPPFVSQLPCLQYHYLSRQLAHPATNQFPYRMNGPSIAAGSVMHPSEAPTIVSPFPTRVVAEPPLSMNLLPNPRFASQIWPIFTKQTKREQKVLAL